MGPQYVTGYMVDVRGSIHGSFRSLPQLDSHWGTVTIHWDDFVNE
jgi:hypothetical protein